MADNELNFILPENYKENGFLEYIFAYRKEYVKTKEGIEFFEDDKRDILLYLGEYENLILYFQESIKQNANREMTDIDYLRIYQWMSAKIRFYLLRDFNNIDFTKYNDFNYFLCEYVNYVNHEDTNIIFALSKYTGIHIDNEPKKKVETEKLTDWQNYLSNNGFLYQDGKRVINNLHDTVKAYVDFTKQVASWQFVQENFIKNDFTNYSQSQCEKAVAYSNN